MKEKLSLFIAFILLLTSLSPLGAVAQSSGCENGECVAELVHKLEDLGTLYRTQCLPKKDLDEKEILQYHQKNGITEQCWKYMTEISHLESKLQQLQSKLESRLGCENGACKGPDSPADDINSQLNELGKVEKTISCNETKKQEIKNNCGSDLKCAMMASALGLGGYLAEKFVPKDWKPRNCHLGDDSCGTQLATGFLKSVVNLFEGAWDLLKAGGKYAKEKASKFWKWIRRGDDHASTSQLALAKASEDEGVFDMLMKDFSGTMVKIFEGLVAAIKEWLKNDIFCNKWEKVPHFSKCEQPVESFDCIPCKSMVNGLCAASGFIIAEIVPAFLTGGIVTAAKHGVNGASKLAKLFSVSAKAMEAIKGSRAAKYAMEAATKVDDVLRVSKGLKLAKSAIEAALYTIKAYLLSPARNILKASLTALTELTKKGSLFLAETKTGKILVFGGKGIKLAGKVVIYPIDNPMTTWAFKAGERSFDKLFKLGAPKLAQATAVSSAITKAEPAMESTLAKIESLKLKSKPDVKKLLKLEEELLAKVGPKRAGLLDDVLAGEKPNLDDIIKHLYPELQYGPLAKKVGPDAILAAEKELLEHLNKMPEGAIKEELLKKFDLHVSKGEARAKVVGDAHPAGVTKPEDVFPNLKKVEIPDVNHNKLVEMMNDKDYQGIILATEVPNRKATARTLKLLEDSGMSHAEAAATYKQHEKYFKHVQGMAKPDSDAQALLAEFIKREKKAGVADDLIDKKLREAFKDCK